MDPRLSWLDSFVAVAEELHFGRAADRVHLSTSAISRHVRLLEEALRYRLFERTSRSVHLTAEGRRLYGEIALPVAAISMALRRDPHTPGHAISVAYVSAPAEREIPAAAARFGRDRLGAGVELRLLPASSSEQRDALMEGSVDIGVHWVYPGTPAPTGLEIAPIRDEPLVVALPLDHQFADSTELRLGDLAGDDWLMAVGSSDLIVRQGFIAACQRAGFLPRIRSEATGFKAQLGLVAAGRGICFAPQVAREAEDQRIVFVPVRDQSVSLVAMTRAAPDRPVRRFIELLRMGG